MPDDLPWVTGSVGLLGTRPIYRMMIAFGGHLLAATVRPTLEVIVVQSPGYLARRFDPASGLALIDVSA